MCNRDEFRLAYTEARLVKAQDVRFGRDELGRLSPARIWVDCLRLLEDPQTASAVAYAMFPHEDGIIQNRMYGRHADRWFAFVTGVRSVD